MGEYFSEATTVLVWLWSSTTGSDTALDQPPQFVRTITALPENIFPSHHSLQSLKLPVSSDFIWHGLGDILCRRWFSRMWTLQEAALEKQAFVYCGLKKVSLGPWGAVIEALADHDMFHLVTCPPELEESWTDHYAKASVIPLVHTMIGSGHTSAPYSLLRAFRARGTSEPVDAVYAILGLMESGIRKHIAVDYSQENRTRYWETYVILGHVMLQQPPDLLLTDASSLDRPPQLPSWCPNFSSPRSTTTMPRKS